MAVFAIGAGAASSASAVEPGVLTLKEVASLTISQPKAEPQANVGILKGAVELKCKKLWVLPGTATPGPTHWTLIKDLDLHITECETAGVKCKTSKDVNGTLLILVDVHHVAFLEGTKLVPGLLLLVLGETELKAPLVMTCGLVKVEITGVITAKATPGAGEEPTTFTVAAEPGLKCDETDKLCIEEFTPLLANGKEATLTTEPQNLTFSTDVLWDF